MASIYKYSAKNKKGNTIKGTLEAENTTEIIKEMGEKGYYVTSIDEQRESSKDIKELIPFVNKVKTHDLALFSQQFSTMIDSGISLLDSLEILQDQVDKKRFREALVEIRQEVETGSNLSTAMSKHPDIFPPLYCEMIMTGEMGGILDNVLLQLADYYERQDEINSKIKGGMYYPTIILVVAIGVIFFLMIGVVPQFIGMFATLGGTLPLPTRILLSISNFMQNFWWALLLGMGGGIYGLKRYLKTARGKNQKDILLLKIPVIKTITQKVYLSRVGSTLAILLDSGVDLLASLEIIENVVGNNVYIDILRNSRQQVREGIPFSETLEHIEQFPKMMVHMIRIGEESGNLEKMLNKISKFYNREVSTAIDGSITLIEPAMIVILGLIVGFIVLSIILPMFDIYQYL